MTTWNPGDRGHEVLSYGSERPPRRPPRLLVGGVVGSLVGVAVGVALGFLVASRADTHGKAATTDEAGRVPPVAAGAVAKVGPSESDGFRVSLFNSADENITATVVALPGWAPRLSGTRPTTIAPRSWGVVRFSAPVDCRTYPATVRVVHVRVRSAEGVAQRIVPLSEPAEVLLDHHEAVCPRR